MKSAAIGRPFLLAGRQLKPERLPQSSSIHEMIE